MTNGQIESWQKDIAAILNKTTSRVLHREGHVKRDELPYLPHPFVIDRSFKCLPVNLDNQCLSLLAIGACVHYAVALRARDQRRLEYESVGLASTEHVQHRGLRVIFAVDSFDDRLRLDAVLLSLASWSDSGHDSRLPIRGQTNLTRLKGHFERCGQLGRIASSRASLATIGWLDVLRLPYKSFRTYIV